LQQNQTVPVGFLVRSIENECSKVVKILFKFGLVFAEMTALSGEGGDDRFCCAERGKGGKRPFSPLTK
jgi:hypothetical protein